MEKNVYAISFYWWLSPSRLQELTTEDDVWPLASCWSGAERRSGGWRCASSSCCQEQPDGVEVRSDPPFHRVLGALYIGNS